MTSSLISVKSFFPKTYHWSYIQNFLTKGKYNMFIVIYYYSMTSYRLTLCYMLRWVGINTYGFII
jgi:hypothetical protein